MPELQKHQGQREGWTLKIHSALGESWYGAEAQSRFEASCPLTKEFPQSEIRFGDFIADSVKLCLQLAPSFRIHEPITNVSVHSPWERGRLAC